ncbi:type III polyketide synthase [soil metagenome]
MSVKTALPTHQVSQDEAVAYARTLFPQLSARAFDRLAPVFEHVRIAHRHVCEPPSWFAEEHTFAERNALYQRWATDLSVEAGRAALDAADVDAAVVGGLVFVSTTGLATPSLDARLLDRLGLPARHTHRESMFGRGCAGGAVGLAQAADRAQLLGRDRPVLLIVAELCSLTFRRRDASVANIISTALFADGVAAAVLSTSPDAGGPEVLGHDGVTWPDTEELMGWTFGDDGLAVMLSKSIPQLVRRELRTSFDDACAAMGIDPIDVRHHLVHPGSAVVLDAVEEALELGPKALHLSRAVLADQGNMSAATVLFILQRFLDGGYGAPGELAVMSALGPGFSAEHVLLRC